MVGWETFSFSLARVTPPSRTTVQKWKRWWWLRVSTRRRYIEAGLWITSPRRIGPRGGHGPDWEPVGKEAWSDAGRTLRVDVTGDVLVPDVLREKLVRHVLLALSRFGPRVRRATVRLAEPANPLGGVDQRCRIHAWLRDESTLHTRLTTRSAAQRPVPPAGTPCSTTIVIFMLP